jgi:hypothetical protein
MVAPASFAWSFRAVAVAERDRVYFAAGHDKSTKQNVPVSFFLRWTGKWVSKPFGINATGICVVPQPDLNVLMMGVDGTIIRATAKGFSEEQVDPGKEGPKRLGDLQEVRRIGKHAYVVGMRRTAYRCDSPAQWSRIDQGVRCAPSDKTDAGFNSIDGFGEGEVYAVGWEGEIWKFDTKQWTAIDSPTNLGLFRVVCAENGKAYACGQRGTILVGRNATWKVLQQDVTKEDFWGATWFRKKLYLSTANGLFVLVGDSIEPVEIKSDKKLKFGKNNSFYRLDANDDVMWSIGEKMAIWTEDGVKWSEIPYS